MLSTKEFAEWSSKVVLFLHNTSRCDDEKYPNLLFQMGGVGFPTMSYLDADGSLLKQVGHVTPVDQLEKAHGELMSWRALRTEVEKGADAQKTKALFLLELTMGNRPFAEMQKRRDALSLSPDELKATEQPLVNLQFTEILRQTPRDQQPIGGEQFVAMFEAGRIPDTSTETSFWQYMFEFAAAKENVPLFEKLLAVVKEKKAGDQRLARYLSTLEERLAALKAKKG
ncbi:MAG: hypothetical protein IPK26_27785 [Planctomycetes bacterium]|nr:hypothetical protein [Planctomycetota bacterium]